MAQHATETEREPPDEDRRCTEFTIGHPLALTTPTDVFGAFVCPGCQKRNPLTGDPADFREQTVRCMGCTRVVVLDRPALVSFETHEWEVRDDE